MKILQKRLSFYKKYDKDFRNLFYQPSAKGCLDQWLGVRFLHLGEDVKMLVEAPARVGEHVTFL